MRCGRLHANVLGGFGFSVWFGGALKAVILAGGFGRGSVGAGPAKPTIGGASLSGRCPSHDMPGGAHRVGIAASTAS